jgi:hypothetical protein
MNDRTDEQRRADYRRGRAASMREWTTRQPLEAADVRGEHAEWYHGYMDYATGRDIWEGPEGRREYAPAPRRSSSPRA